GGGTLPALNRKGPSQSRRHASASRQNGPSASRDRRVPWGPFRTEPSMRSPAPLLSSADALSQQGPFRRILGKLQRTVERGRDLAFAAELAEQLGSGGMVQVIVLQLVRQTLQLRQRRLRTGDVTHSDGAVQAHYRRRPEDQQRVVEQQDLRPVGCLPGGCLGVAGCDRRLQLIR